MRELPQFQIHDDEGSKSSVKKHQVHPIPLRADSQTLLTGDEREIIAQLQEELFEAVDERILEVRFRILVLEIQELEHERVTDVRVGR
jgi:hypothetical protein